jgi:hypothetical protein
VPYLQGYPGGMHRFTAFLTLCVALLALLSPSFAAGVCIAHNGLPVVTTSNDGGTAQLPNPCEMQGGKRVMPVQPDFGSHEEVEVPRATWAQWAMGLADQPMRQGRSPLAELPPPRLG